MRIEECCSCGSRTVVEVASDEKEAAVEAVREWRIDHRHKRSFFDVEEAAPQLVLLGGDGEADDVGEDEDQCSPFGTERPPVPIVANDLLYWMRFLGGVLTSPDLTTVRPRTRGQHVASGEFTDINGDVWKVRVERKGRHSD